MTRLPGEVEADLQELEGEGIALPPSVHARLRRHEALRKIPREREGREGRSKPHRVRRRPD